MKIEENDSLCNVIVIVLISAWKYEKVRYFLRKFVS